MGRQAALGVELELGESPAAEWEVDGYDCSSVDTKVVAGFGREEEGGGGCGGVVGVLRGVSDLA